MKRSRIKNADWSTINLDELHKLKKYDYAKDGYHLQDDSGNGCAGDPPGYPTYFTQSVYSRSGNDPASGFSLVIVHEGQAYGVDPVAIKWAPGETWETHQAKHDALMRRLWKSLPIDHPRTQAWIRATFLHHHSCYQVPELRAQGKNWSDAGMIWPGGCLGRTPFGQLKKVALEVEYKTKHEGFDKWREDEQAKFIADIEAENQRITRLCSEIATPDNHDGTIIVRRYYPEFNPTPDLIAAGFQSPGNWWETLREHPGADCPGQYGKDHPVNGSWCQFCGYHEAEEKQEAPQPVTA